MINLHFRAIITIVYLQKKIYYQNVSNIMILARAPLRMSFVGWGSDIASFYRQHVWAVLSTSINQYIYISLNPKFDQRIRLSYNKTEIVDTFEELEHDLAKEIIKFAYGYLNSTNWVNNYIPKGIEIASIADIPSEWSWLGSSSSFTVWLLHALYAYNHRYVSAQTLAEHSCKIEIDICNKPIGKQDQYASAYGWLNFIEFFPDDTVQVAPIVFSREKKNEIESNLLMFYTGITRSADNILGEQTKNLWEQIDKITWMKKMVALAYDLKQELENDNVQRFWDLLHENRKLKKNMAGGISDPKIDTRYEKAMKAGATGGKLLWAGGGGFFVFYVPAEHHNDVKNALSDLRHVPFSFDTWWSQIIHYKD